jgi:membrane-associated phospholipid phosphatase
VTGPPVTLAAVIFGWGAAYRIGYARDRWAAWRRDTHRLLTASTLTGLDHAIQDDYRHRPVPRDFDPPGAAAYLSFPDGHGVTAEDTDFILGALLFPVPNPSIPDPIAIICTRCGQAFVCDATSPAARDQRCLSCGLGPAGEDLSTN